MTELINTAILPLEEYHVLKEKAKAMDDMNSFFEPIYLRCVETRMAGYDVTNITSVKVMNEAEAVSLLKEEIRFLNAELEKRTKEWRDLKFPV